MKRILFVFLLITVLLAVSCSETHYYAHYNDHSPRYYRHHPRTHVDVDIHN